MLRSVFVIFFFQLMGEAVKKIFEIRIPGPVIGLILLLITLILLKRVRTKYVNNLKKEASTILQQIEDTQASIVNTPFKKSSITAPAGLPLTGSATGSGNTANIIQQATAGNTTVNINSSGSSNTFNITTKAH